MRTGRTALVTAFVAGLVLGASAPAGAGGGAGGAEPLRPQASGQAFTEPPRLTSTNGVLTFDLVARNGAITVAGADVNGRAFSDGIVGPTLVVNPGDTIALTLDNQLPAHTNLHFHGLHVSPMGNSDNIFLEVHPGERFAYSVQLPSDHPTGTFWYHSHAHGISEEQVFGGLSGVIIVNGLQQLLPAALQSVQDVTLALKDAQVVGDTIEVDNIDSNAPTTRVVNSAHLPVLPIAPGEVQLWRLANIGADIWYDAALDGQAFTVIGEDGNPVWTVRAAKHLVLPPGKRYDVLVTGPASGSTTLRTRRYLQGGDTYPARPLMKVNVTGAAVSTPPMPTSLATPVTFPDSEVVRRRTMVFTEKDEQNEFFINGKEFDPNRVDARPKLGTVEEWTLVNKTSEQHPFHIHVNDFLVVSVGGVPYDAPGLQDTVPLYPGKDVVIRQRFADFTGKFVFHCHILNHEDNGMMAVVEVVP
jgi:FtsP/CotA-like multicopper oxidase with cupredoxin domain